jgi:dethiobiotin synthetase
MKIFITGTNTNIGKTVISSWLCAHSSYSYFKPIQTGGIEGTDSKFVKQATGVDIYPESYLYKVPLSPHLAASLEGSEIDINNIKLPDINNLIIEGAGGVMVPLNKQFLMIDLIKKLELAVIIVSISKLGTINHTLLTIEALQARGIKILGVIMNKAEREDKNAKAIEFYGKVDLLGSLPQLSEINNKTLKSVPLGPKLNKIFSII